tara:strand:+ start:2411 stop:2668 length:258 start_codon:yes stop_codon:yes gene_type:complete
MATIKTQLIDRLKEKFPNNEFRYTDIIKTLIEDIKRMGPYNQSHRGYYSTNLSDGHLWNGYLRKGSKSEPRFLENLGTHWAILNS